MIPESTEPELTTVPLPAKVEESILETDAGKWAAKWFDHGHTPTEEEINLAAYYLWLGEGCPWNNPALTFANWIDAKGNLENKHFPPPPPPTE